MQESRWKGKNIQIVMYNAEIDFSDKGTIKMIDAYVRVQPLSPLKITAG